ncbi:MAG: hypothetical protein AAGE52_25315 [Myxococcota bacterium]
MAKKSLNENVVEAILHAFLEGIAPDRIRGVYPQQPLDDVFEVLGKPTEEVVEELGEGPHRRILATYRWSRTRGVRGVDLRETLDIGFHRKPDYGLTSLGVRVQTVEPAPKETKEAFKELKLRLLDTFPKGRNKSSFRAPDLATERLEEGFVAVFLNTHDAPFIHLNCGVVI